MLTVINEVLSKAYIASISNIKERLISELGLSEIEANYITSYYTAIKELNLFSSKTFKNFEYDGELFDLNDVQKFVKFPESFYDIVMLVFHNKIFLEKYTITFNGITVKLDKKKLEQGDEELGKVMSTPFDAYKVAEDENYYTFYAPSATIAKEFRTFYAEVYSDEDIKKIPDFFFPNWCIVSSQAGYHFSKEKHSKSDIWLITYLKQNPAELIRKELNVDSLWKTREAYQLLSSPVTREAIALRNKLGEIYLMKKDGNVGMGRNYGYHNYSNMQSKDRKVSDLIPPTFYSYASINISENKLFLKQFEIEEGKLKKCFANTKVVKVPFGVIEIESEAFKKLNSVEQVVLPPSLLKISTQAFVDMPLLKKVFVHNTLEVIESNAFKNVKNYENSINGIFDEGVFLFGVLEKEKNTIVVSKPAQLRFAPRELTRMYKNVQEKAEDMKKYMLDTEKTLEESFRVKRPSYEMLDYFSIEGGNRLIFDADPKDAVNVTDITVPEGVEYIFGSLKNFVNLTTLIFSSTVKEVKGLNMSSSKAISDLKKLKVLDMSQSQVEDLTSFKLSGLINLRTVLLPKTIKEINSEFFASTGIENIFVPASIANQLQIKTIKNTPFLEVISTDSVDAFITNASEEFLNYVEKQKIILVEKEH